MNSELRRPYVCNPDGTLFLGYSGVGGRIERAGFAVELLFSGLSTEFYSLDLLHPPP